MLTIRILLLLALMAVEVVVIEGHRTASLAAASLPAAAVSTAIDR